MKEDKEYLLPNNELWIYNKENLLLNSTAKLSFAPINPRVAAGQNDLLANVMPMTMKITNVNLGSIQAPINVVYLKRVYDHNGQEMDPNEPSKVNLMLMIVDAAEAKDFQGGTWINWLNNNIGYDGLQNTWQTLEAVQGDPVTNGIILTIGPHWDQFITPNTGLIINNLTFDNIIDANNGCIGSVS